MYGPVPPQAHYLQVPLNPRNFPLIEPTGYKSPAWKYFSKYHENYGRSEFVVCNICRNQFIHDPTKSADNWEVRYGKSKQLVKLEEHLEVFHPDVVQSDTELQTALNEKKDRKRLLHPAEPVENEAKKAKVTESTVYSHLPNQLSHRVHKHAMERLLANPFLPGYNKYDYNKYLLRAMIALGYPIEDIQLFGQRATGSPPPKLTENELLRAISELKKEMQDEINTTLNNSFFSLAIQNWRYNAKSVGQSSSWMVALGYFIDDSWNLRTFCLDAWNNPHNPFQNSLFLASLVKNKLEKHQCVSITTNDYDKEFANFDNEHFSVNQLLVEVDDFFFRHSFYRTKSMHKAIYETLYHGKILDMAPFLENGLYEQNDIEQISIALEPIREFLEYFRGDFHVTISLLPYFTTEFGERLEFWDQLHPKNIYVKILKEIYKKHWSLTSLPYYSILASALDPRTKCLNRIPIAQVGAIWNKLCDEVIAHNAEIVNRGLTFPNLKIENSANFLKRIGLDSMAGKETIVEQVEREIYIYRSIPVIPMVQGTSWYSDQFPYTGTFKNPTVQKEAKFAVPAQSEKSLDEAISSLVDPVVNQPGKTTTTESEKQYFLQFTNPLLWWKANEQLFPHLANYAKKILSIPVSTECDEGFFRLPNKDISTPFKLSDTVLDSKYAKDLIALHFSNVAEKGNLMREIGK